LMFSHPSGEIIRVSTRARSNSTIQKLRGKNNSRGASTRQLPWTAVLE
jgi:hypothetical protein